MTEAAAYEARRQASLSGMSYEVDIDAVTDMYRFIGKQAPYAISRGINSTLVGAQGVQISKMRNNFTIRNEAFLRNSIRIKFASPKPIGGTIGGSIFIADLGGKKTSNIWNPFESGGIKRPTKGKNIAVPTDNAWPNRNRVKPERNKPRNLANSFVVKEGANSFIFSRKGKTRRKNTTGRDPNVKLMYVLTKSTPIPRKLFFYNTVLPYIRNKGSSHFNDELRRTIYMAQLRGSKQIGPMMNRGYLRVEI